MPDIKTDHHIGESELQLLFIASYFDGPIKGLAKYRGQIVRFVVEPETLFTGKELYRIEQLSEEELQYELEKKHCLSVRLAHIGPLMRCPESPYFAG